MTTDGKHLYKALDQVRGLHVEVARMLSDCDRLMAEHEWIAPNTTTVSGSSASINNPSKWSPHAVFRTYLNEAQPNVTKVISVIFEDEWHNSLDEPVIVASTYQTIEDGFVAFLWWNHTWWWFNFTDSIANGEIKTITTSNSDSAEFQKEIKRFKKIVLFGCPMIEVTGTDSIESKVINPLVGN